MGLSPRVLSSLLLEDLSAHHPFFTGVQSLTGSPGMSVQNLAAVRLANSLVRKLSDNEDRDAEAKAFSLWVQNNDRCKNWELRLNTSSDEMLWGEFKNSLYHFFTDDDFSLSWENILENSRVGPGVSILTKSTDLYSKLFSSPMAATSSLLHELYARDTMCHPTWNAAEKYRSGAFGSTIVRGSRLAFVPKTTDIRRSICVEPNLNIYLQLGLMSILSARLFRKFGISMQTQPDKNRELARLGSIDGSFATIDLSSASDSISLKLCQEVLPPHILGFLHQLRSPVTSYRGSEIELHMVSSMGNGFTFPLQTIIFACIIQAAYRCRGLQMERPFDSLGNFGVFGDDLIVDTKSLGLDVFRSVSRLLQLSGFLVNDEKSFFEGSFRESCGHEYYLGSNVRGVYLKTLLGLTGKFTAINRLLEWSSSSGILLPRTISYLRRFVPDLFVPFDCPINGGIRVPLSIASPRRNRDCQSYMYSYMSPKALTYSFSEQGTPDRLASRLGLSYNPCGLWMTFLSGHLRDGCVGVRSNSPRFHRRRKVTPFWDYFPTVAEVNPRYGWRQWETTVALTLTDK